MKGQLYCGMWLPLSWDEKNYIAKSLGIPRNGATHVVNNRIQSDGYTDEDLNKIDVSVLQRELKSSETDFFKLWDSYVTTVRDAIKPVISPAKPIEKPHEVSVNITVNREGEIISEQTKVAIKKTQENVKKSKAVEGGTTAA